MFSFKIIIITLERYPKGRFCCRFSGNDRRVQFPTAILLFEAEVVKSGSIAVEFQCNTFRIETKAGVDSFPFTVGEQEQIATGNVACTNNVFKKRGNKKWLFPFYSFIMRISRFDRLTQNRLRGFFKKKRYIMDYSFPHPVPSSRLFN